jgi:hypothetical protein
MDMHIYSWGWKSGSNCIEQAHSYLVAWSMGEYSIGKQHSNSLWDQIRKLGYPQVCNDFGKLFQ